MRKDYGRITEGMRKECETKLKVYPFYCEFILL